MQHRRSTLDAYISKQACLQNLPTYAVYFPVNFTLTAPAISDFRDFFSIFAGLLHLHTPFDRRFVYIGFSNASLSRVI